MKLLESPFLHVVSVSEECVALYNSLTMEIAFLKKSFMNKCKQGRFWSAADVISRNALESLRKIGLLSDEQGNGYELYKKYQKAFDEPAINILYLLLSDACNIRCRYCYFLAPMPKSYRASLMESETAIKALNLFSRCVKKSIAGGHPDQHIVLYGGEPTINKNTLLAALRYTDLLKEKDDLPKKTSITVNTNGILLDKEIIEQCKTSEAVVAISIDGPKEIHDQMRVYNSGRGTFDEVVRSYRLAQQIGAKTGICVTIDKHNLFQMEKIVRWFADELSVKGMGFNILIENSTEPTNGQNVDYAEIVAQKLIESFKLARTLGIYEDRMMRRVKNFLDKTPVLSDCGGCGLQIVVSPDGKIGVCQAFCGEKKFFVDEPFETFEPEINPFWREWRKRSPFTNEVCKGCIALGNCGGGCPYNAYRIKGAIDALDERFCIHAKATTNFLINDLWEKQKG